MLRIAALTLALSMMGGLAIAERGVDADNDTSKVFDKWLAPDAPECISMKEIKSVPGMSVINLTPEQFQFTRALYVTILPNSRNLPVGDYPVIAKDGGKAMLALVTGDKESARTCARFMAPDFIQDMLDKVATGYDEKPGDQI
jgi:hypothetical protein